MISGILNRYKGDIALTRVYLATEVLDGKMVNAVKPTNMNIR